MYVLADLIIILVFLIGSAILGFLLGRRSFRGQVDQLQAQLQDRQRAMTDMKTKLNRCTSKRVALEQELTEVRTHLSGREIDGVPSSATPVNTEASPTAKAPSAAPAPSGRRGTPLPAARRQFSGKPNERKAQASPQKSPPTGSAEAKPPSKQDEALARVRTNASKVNFDRIGTANASQRDDLKQVNGIGIFTEKKLNALGIYTFEQIARFNQEDEHTVNHAIEFFPGRITRDAWVAQARELQKRG